MDTNKWRYLIIDKVQQRNKVETEPFQDLVNYHNRLFEEVSQLRTENLNLTLQTQRFRGVPDTDHDNTGHTIHSEQVLALESRLQQQTEELNNLHKWKSNHAQEIITLNANLHDTEKELAARDYTISENKALIASLRAEIQLYENSMQELQGLNQDLRDEYQALQIAFSSIQDKLRKTQDENRQLVEKLIKYKSKDADKMNEENENFLKSSNASAFLFNTLGRLSFGKKSEKLRRELDEAAREGGGRSSSCSESDAAYYASTLPSRVLLKFDAHDGEVNAVKWCPADKYVATGGSDRKVRLWDITKIGTHENRGDLVGSNQAIMSVDFESSGTYLVAASNDFASRIWTVADSRLKETLTGHSGKVMAAKFLGEANKVITGSHDRTLRIWDLKSRSCADTKFAGSACNDVVTSDASGSTIISGHFDKKIRFWDIRAESYTSEILLQGKITSLDLSRDYNYLLACVRDDTIQLIDLRKNAIVRSFCHESFKVGCDWSRAAFIPSGRSVCAGSADGAVLLWSTTTGRLETTLKDHTSAVTAVSFHPINCMLASVDRKKQITIWVE